MNRCRGSYKMPFDYGQELIEICGCSWTLAEWLYEIENEPNTTVEDDEEDEEL